MPSRKRAGINPAPTAAVGWDWSQPTCPATVECVKGLIEHSLKIQQTKDLLLLDRTLSDNDGWAYGDVHDS